MKKKTITVLMTAMIAMSIAACGDKDAQESVPASGTADQSETERDAGGESGSQEEGSDITDEENQMGTDDAMEENSGTEDSEAGDDASDISSMFADVDWDAELYQYEDFEPSESYKPKCDNVRRTLTNVALYAIIHGNTGEEEVRYESENDWNSLGYTYDTMDEESKEILDRLVALSIEDLMELRNEVLVAAHDPEGVFADVDWSKVIYESDDGTYRVKYVTLTNIAFTAQNTERTVEETISDKEYWWGEAGLTYDMLDEEAKAVLDHLMTLNPIFEISPLRSMVIDPWIEAKEALEEE